MTRLMTNDQIGRRQPSRWPKLANARGAIAPPTSRMTAPASGSAMTTQASEKTPSAAVGSTTGTSASENIVVLSGSVLEQAGFVDRGRASGPEDGHDDR